MNGVITHARFWRCVDRMGHCCLFIVKRTATKQKAFDKLEKRVAALEQERKRPES
ncbi:hypothetical protein [Brevibacillus brevis]|uniref:hypothetical protein n=1 Tax=Brevibacillus brevis TaxID=1393 RepID=UPI001901D342|nr:hypothetical protein [Brevibacillus brevis]